MATRQAPGIRHIGELQARQQRDEFRIGLRALLMQPLMAPAHEDFPAVRRQADKLRDWFARETGWVLEVEREGARLYKRPADLLSATRGMEDFDRRRYVLLCLACAVLERADPQITLHLLGQRVMEMAAEPTLVARQFSFTLRTAAERRDLVAVCRSLLAFGVLQRVAGDEDGFVHDSAGSAQSDALYDIQRRLLAGMLAAVRGPSTWAAEDAPVTLDDRLRALVTEHVADSDEGRRTVLRHALARRLLDDPVVYAADLDTETQGYFANQRGGLESLGTPLVTGLSEQWSERCDLVAAGRPRGGRPTRGAGARPRPACPTSPYRASPVPRWPDATAPSGGGRCG